MAARIKRRTRKENQELQQVKRMLDRRYNELKSGKVKGIEVFEQLRQKSESRRSSNR